MRGLFKYMYVGRNEQDKKLAAMTLKEQADNNNVVNNGSSTTDTNTCKPDSGNTSKEKSTSTPQLQPQETPQSVSAQPNSQQSNLASYNQKELILQEQLILLLHAHNCEMASQKNETWKCSLPYCKLMKGVLKHMTSCEEGVECKKRFCLSSRVIVNHYKRCEDNGCTVCIPVKKDAERVRNNKINGITGPAREFRFCWGPIEEQTNE